MTGRLSGNQASVYPFRGSLEDSRGRNAGSLIGTGIGYTQGISDAWGALSLPGGGIGQNAVSLPVSFFVSSSFTFCFWLRPEAEINWSSIFYLRAENGFLSFVPYTNADNGISVLRFAPDNDPFFDVIGSIIPRDQWSFLCFAVDMPSEYVAYYLNGKKVLEKTGIPTLIGCVQTLLGADSFQPSFQGLLSAFRVCDYALSDREVAVLYQSHLAEPGFRGNRPEMNEG